MVDRLPTPLILFDGVCNLCSWSVQFLAPRDRNGVLFTMYMRQTAGADRFELSRRKDMQVCIWQNDDLSVVMLGEMPAHEMLKVATATYADLNF